MSRLFEMLTECDQCGRHSFGSVVLYLLNEDRTARFCTPKCKTRWLDTHPSDRGDSDPRFEAL